MNWDQIQGKWKQLKGEIQSRWGELTDDELDKAAGSREKFEGLLQERYGLTKEQAREQIDSWAGSMRD